MKKNDSSRPFLHLSGWLSAICAASCLSSCAPKNLVTTQVIFADEFNTSSSRPDPAVWKLCRPNASAWAQHFEHVEGYETVRVEDGFLKLTIKKENGHYKNAGIRTRNTFPLHSRLEVKARLTRRVRGGFPAIWQMPPKGPWPVTGEIDLMEWVQGTPNKIYQTIHYDPSGLGKDVAQHEAPMKDVTEWHVYAVDRTDDALIFYVDGKETWRYTNPRTGNWKDYPFNQHEFDVILNYSLGGTLKNGRLSWPGHIHDEDLPGEMWVDWVRITPLKNR